MFHVITELLFKDIDLKFCPPIHQPLPFNIYSVFSSKFVIFRKVILKKRKKKFEILIYFSKFSQFQKSEIVVL